MNNTGILLTMRVALARIFEHLDMARHLFSCPHSLRTSEDVVRDKLVAAYSDVRKHIIYQIVDPMAGAKPKFLQLAYRMVFRLLVFFGAQVSE